jgi:carbohydrate diacid regulator
LNYILAGSGINETFILEFAENDLNVSQASKAMFIHRNTMIYKLNKLKANSQFDLTNFKDAYILYSLLENK